LVIVHGETIVEPVAPGTNRAAIEAGVDILAHPGLISKEEVQMAGERSVFLELTSRKGHSLTNGHVAKLAAEINAPLVVNSDAHGPGDIWPVTRIREIAQGAGLDDRMFSQMMTNTRTLVQRCLE
jgi:histidinol phosphatase-like PHP family hydrolase